MSERQFVVEELLRGLKTRAKRFMSLSGKTDLSVSTGNDRLRIVSSAKNALIIAAFLCVVSLVPAAPLFAGCPDVLYPGSPAELVLENSEIRIEDAKAIDSGKSRPFRVTSKNGQSLILKRASRYSEVLARPEKEVAAYRMSKLLGLEAVPLTVLKKIDGLTYSVQVEIKKSPLALNDDPWKKYQNDSNLRFFDYLIGMKDRHEDNLLWDGSRVVLIDHSSAYVQVADLDHVPIHSPFTLPEGETLKRFLAVSEADYKNSLGDLLSQSELQYVLERAALVQFFLGVAPEKISVNSKSVVEIQWTKSATDDEILEAATQASGIGNCTIKRQNWPTRVEWNVSIGFQRAGEFKSPVEATQRLRELIALGECHRYRWR